MNLLERPQALLADSFFASFGLLSAKIGATGLSSALTRVMVWLKISFFRAQASVP